VEGELGEMKLGLLILELGSKVKKSVEALRWCEELGATPISFLGLSSVIEIVEHIPGELCFEIYSVRFRVLCILGIGFQLVGFGYRVLIWMLDCRFLLKICLIFLMFRCCPTILTLMCSLWSPFNGVCVSYRFVGGICCNKCILLWVSGNFTCLQAVPTFYDGR